MLKNRWLLDRYFVSINKSWVCRNLHPFTRIRVFIPILLTICCSHTELTGNLTSIPENFNFFLWRYAWNKGRLHIIKYSNIHDINEWMLGKRCFGKQRTILNWNFIASALATPRRCREKGKVKWLWWCLLYIGLWGDVVVTFTFDEINLIRDQFKPPGIYFIHPQINWFIRQTKTFDANIAYICLSNKAISRE